MNYSKRDLKTMDAFALCLILIGGLAWFAAVRPYMIDQRYRKAAFGSTQPYIIPIPATFGTILILLGGVLNVALIHHQKSDDAPFKPDSQSCV